jgi:rhodanese-related sulfurtransferase
LSPVTEEIDVREALHLRDSAGAVFVDVREPWELEICRIAEAIHIPMGEIPSRLNEIPGGVPLVVMCHHGMRSRQVMQFLARSGRSNLKNMQGGIDAWAREIDSSLATY